MRKIILTLLITLSLAVQGNAQTFSFSKDGKILSQETCPTCPTPVPTSCGRCSNTYIGKWASWTDSSPACLQPGMWGPIAYVDDPKCNPCPPVVGELLVLNQQHTALVSAGVSIRYKISVPDGAGYFRLSVTTETMGKAEVTMEKCQKPTFKTVVSFNSMADWTVPGPVSGDYQLTIMGIDAGVIKITPMVSY